MNDKDLDQSLNDLLIKLQNDDQLSLDLDLDNMNSCAGQPALTISSVSDDTITLGTNIISGISSQNFQYDYSKSLNSGYSISTTSPTYNYGSIGTNGSGGSIGSILTTGTSGISWNDLNTVNQGTLQVKGDADFDGDVKIKGKSITEMFEKIEEKLAILRPNEKLEEKWEQLRELRNRYVELEKEIIEKEKMWDILKK